MGNPFKSIIKGVGRFFGVPFDFITGKNCDKVCGPTWDIVCYLENFCFTHVLKFVAVTLLSCIVLLVVFLLYKLKILHLVFISSFKMLWAFIRTIFSCWENGCRCLFGILNAIHVKLNAIRERRKQHKRDIELANMNSKICEEDEEDSDVEASVSYHKERYRKRRRSWSGDHKRRSLRARSHRVHVGVDDSVHSMKRKHVKHDDVRVIRTSSFAKKGLSHKRSKHAHKKHEV